MKKHLDLTQQVASKEKAPPPIEEEDWHADMVHQLLVQFVAFAPPDGPSPPPQAVQLSFQMYHFEARTTPLAKLQRPDEATAAAKTTGGAEGSVTADLRIEVTSLTLTPPMMHDANLTQVFVEVKPDEGGNQPDEGGNQPDDARRQFHSSLC